MGSTWGWRSAPCSGWGSSSSASRSAPIRTAPTRTLGPTGWPGTRTPTPARRSVCPVRTSTRRRSSSSSGRSGRCHGPGFVAGWTLVLLVATAYLAGPELLAIVALLAASEIWGGNISLLLAVAIVVGFRWPAAWAFVAADQGQPRGRPALVRRPTRVGPSRRRPRGDRRVRRALVHPGDPRVVGLDRRPRRQRVEHRDVGRHPDPAPRPPAGRGRGHRLGGSRGPSLGAADRLLPGHAGPLVRQPDDPRGEPPVPRSAGLEPRSARWTGSPRAAARAPARSRHPDGRPHAPASRILLPAMVTERDYYEVLGVERGASDAEIKRAFRKLAQQWHPDVNTEAAADSRFKEINEAYQVLSDPQKKQAYDLFGRAGRRRRRVARGPATSPGSAGSATSSTRSSGRPPEAAPAAPDRTPGATCATTSGSPSSRRSRGPRRRSSSRSSIAARPARGAGRRRAPRPPPAPSATAGARSARSAARSSARWST